MNALAVVFELPGILLGPLWCRLRGPRWYRWATHAAPDFTFCMRCGRTSKEHR